MTDTIVIPRRYCGPPDSANGGYACGAVAAVTRNPAEVTLRTPPPLDTVMDVERGDDGRVAVRSGGELVAEAVAIDALGLDPPDPVAFDDAVAAAETSWIRHEPHRHPFPTCVICGPGRAAGDGARMFVGAVPGRALAAAGWIPDASWPTSGGRVDPVIVWAVLDCAGGIGAGIGYEHEPVDPHVLGRFAGDVRDTPAVGERCVAMGWRIERDGRKLFAGSAVYGEDDRLLGLARATWIELRTR